MTVELKQPTRLEGAERVEEHPQRREVEAHDATSYVQFEDSWANFEQLQVIWNIQIVKLLHKLGRANIPETVVKWPNLSSTAAPWSICCCTFLHSLYWGAGFSSHAQDQYSWLGCSASAYSCEVVPLKRLDSKNLFYCEFMLGQNLYIMMVSTATLQLDEVRTRHHSYCHLTAGTKAQDTAINCMLDTPSIVCDWFFLNILRSDLQSCAKEDSFMISCTASSSLFLIPAPSTWALDNGPH